MPDQALLLSFLHWRRCLVFKRFHGLQHLIKPAEARYQVMTTALLNDDSRGSEQYH
jgi:hypothetical protein